MDAELDDVPARQKATEAPGKRQLMAAALRFEFDQPQP